MVLEKILVRKCVLKFSNTKSNGVSEFCIHFILLTHFFNSSLRFFGSRLHQNTNFETYWALIFEKPFWLFEGILWYKYTWSLRFLKIKYSKVNFLYFGLQVKGHIPNCSELPLKTRKQRCNYDFCFSSVLQFTLVYLLTYFETKQ